MRFSQRFGYKPVREIIQKESMDEKLKNQLWNNIGLCIFRKYKNSSTLVRNHPISNSNLEVFFSFFYHYFLRKRIDQIPYSLDETIRNIEVLFFKE